jgi:hypothetical protein
VSKKSELTMRDSDDLPSRYGTRNQTSSAVETIAGACEVDRAIAKLVLAFGTDPVARWMYDNPHEYLLHIPRLFRALGKSSFEAGAAQRTSDGYDVALWLPPGVRGDDGPLEAVLAESIAGGKLVDVGSVFEMTEHYRPTEPHWYFSLIGVEVLHWNEGVGLPCCSMAFANATGSIARHISGPRTRKILLCTAGMASRSWIRSRSARRLPSFRCCASHAEGTTALAPCRPRATLRM